MPEDLGQGDRGAARGATGDRGPIDAREPPLPDLRHSRRIAAARVGLRRAIQTADGNIRTGALFWGLARPYLWLVLLGMGLNALHGLAIVFQNNILPLIIGFVQRHGEPTITNRSAWLWSLAWLLIGYLLMSVFGRMAVWHAGYRIFTYVRERMLFALRSTFFEHLNHLCLRFHLRHNSGELFSYLFGSPLGQIIGFFQQASGGLPGAIMTVVFTLGVLAVVDWPMMVLSMVTLIGLLLIMQRSRATVKRLQKEFQEAERQVSGRVADLLRGHRAVKLYAMEEQAGRDFDGQATLIGRKSYMVAIKGHMENMKYEAAAYLAFAVVTFMAGWRYAQGEISLAGFTAFPINFLAIQGPMSQIFHAAVAWGSAQASMERIATVLRTASTTPDPVGTVHPAPPRGEVRFQDVTFRYAEGLEPVLRGFTLTIPVGQKIALVGPSGAGKSTITQLILRLYDPAQGTITIAGVDLRSVVGSDLRRHFGLVPQDPFIFSTTVRNNVRVAKNDATDAEIEDACRRANAWEFIEALDKRLDHLLGEGGADLSGGQRQRLAIARALLADPGFYIFDEATSALDTLSERLIQETLDRELGGATCIFIAHRLATVRHCDRIVVIDQGRAVQDGTFDELAERPGLFRQLVRDQTLAS